MYNKLIYERSEFVPKQLKDIEDTFKNLKKDFKNKQYRLKLVEQIKTFTNIDKIVIYYEKDVYNAGVIPVYKKEISSSIVDIARDIVGGKSYDEDSLSPQKLKKISSVVESSKYIDTIYIFLGLPLIKNLTSAQFVALLLHELGHVFSMTSDIAYYYMRVIKMIAEFSLTAYAIGRTLQLIDTFFPIFTFGMCGLVYGVTLSNRRSEVAADRYAVKYGYGDDLISLFSLFNKNITIRNKSDRKSFKVKFEKFMTFIKDVMMTLIFRDEHPTEQRRIDNIEDLIFEKYKKLYPEYTKEIDDIQNKEKQKK